MRIIGGKYRGKKLISPVSKNIRPTSDKAREAIFNILRNKFGGNFYGRKLIDVFAGSGAFGLEALSQGFSEIALVDIDVSDLQKNVRLFATENDKIKVIKADATKKIIVDKKYDVLFMDAPYKMGLTELALECAKECLIDGALCLIELEKGEDCILPSNYKLIDERCYGIAKIVIAEFIL